MSDIICGIYRIRNIVDGKIYIGSSVNVASRLRQHLHSLRRGDHKSPYLQAAFNCHGEDNFRCKVLERCSRQILIEREQYYIDTLHPEYNSAPFAGSPMLGRKQTQEHIQKRMKKTVEKMRGRRLSQSHRDAIAEANFGQKRTKTQKKNMSDAAKARAGKYHISETRRAALKRHYSSEENLNRLREMGRRGAEAKWRKQTS